MFSFSEYLMVWLIYLLCVLGLLAVFWRMTRTISWLYFKQSMRLVFAILLLIPARVEEAPLYWSPAWVKAILMVVFSDGEEIWKTVKLLLTGSLLALLVYCVLLIVLSLQSKRLYTTRRAITHDRVIDL